ncbi:MAG: hypothetical protein V3S18_00330 [Dehalococcoidia bacterium]
MRITDVRVWPTRVAPDCACAPAVPDIDGIRAHPAPEWQRAE